MVLEFKNILLKDKNVKDYIIQNYGFKIDVKYSSIGFVVVPKNKNYVVKYYVSDKFIAFYNKVFREYNLFEKEKQNYSFFQINNILIPNYISYGECCIGGYIYKYAKLENIRSNGGKVSSFKDLDIKMFSNFIKNIHMMKIGYIHGNIHVNNFFIKNGNIGIFNLTSYYKGDIEEDISKVCYGYGLDINFIKSFLLLYGIEKIKWNKLLYKIYYLTKLYSFDKKQFFQLVDFIKEISRKNL